ncbi:DUF5959 family protein [Streptomyces sp. NBC_01013]|uniref:DUF5959 family protein n=1 Tax=Streptomyces sp. NBC_01013 TaxID=2903718 RepID=UPI00386D98B8|nr:DUF5959 family protein [Streptomyces sp. NBC_01013]
MHSSQDDDHPVITNGGTAMGDIAARELISLADDEGNSVTVNVLGLDPGWSAGLEAEIVVRTPFVSGRTYLVLSTSKLGGWAAALDRLEAGEDVIWMEWDRGPSVSVQLSGERDCPEVVVEDESLSMVTVRVPLVPPDDWIADHRRRLHRVRDHWVPLLSE